MPRSSSERALPVSTDCETARRSLPRRTSGVALDDARWSQRGHRRRRGRTASAGPARRPRWWSSPGWAWKAPGSTTLVAEAGVAHGTFYRYFDGKAELFERGGRSSGDGHVRPSGRPALGARRSAGLDEWTTDWFATYLDHGAILSVWTEAPRSEAGLQRGRGRGRRSTSSRRSSTPTDRSGRPQDVLGRALADRVVALPGATVRGLRPGADPPGGRRHPRPTAWPGPGEGWRHEGRGGRRALHRSRPLLHPRPRGLRLPTTTATRSPASVPVAAGHEAKARQGAANCPEDAIEVVRMTPPQSTRLAPGPHDRHH